MYNKVKQVSYCPKCGNKVEETMAFCPRCGASLKPAAPGQPTPTQPYPRHEKAEKNEKQEKQEKNQNPEKHEKGEHGFIGFLIGGLILITFGVFALLQISGGIFSSGQGFAIMLLIIGIIIIFGAIYVAMTSKRHFPKTT
jgi:predicted lipid-binding transport protein (Tim44 family)/ribosomal protein S27AE